MSPGSVVEKWYSTCEIEAVVSGHKLYVYFTHVNLNILYFLFWSCLKVEKRFSAEADMLCRCQYASTNTEFKIHTKIRQGAPLFFNLCYFQFCVSCIFTFLEITSCINML